MASKKISAGLMMFRHPAGGALEVFLAHMGGPYFRNKDDGSWTIPKGEPEPGEALFETATREFQEEIGVAPEPPFLPLGTARQKGGKVVHAWAFEGDWDPSRELTSNTFEIEWPPRSGRRQRFPEIDRAEFFEVGVGREKINPAQAVFIDRLEAALAGDQRSG